MILARAAVVKNIKNAMELMLKFFESGAGFMKLKLFFVFLLIGLSLQAQTQPIDTSDELDVTDELDIDPDVPLAAPAEPAIPAPPAKPVAAPTPVETPPPVAVVIPRVYQTLMPTKKQHAVTPAISAVGYSAIDKRNEDIKYMYSSVETAIAYEYGLTNNQAIGIDLSYVSNVNRVTFLSNESTEKLKGFSNPSVHYKALFNLFGVSFFGYGGYSFKLEKETVDTDKREGNTAKGQNKATLVFGGYKAVNSDYVLGGFVNYIYGFDGEKLTKSASTSETTKLSKGDRMITSVFMEIQNEWRPNLALSFSKNFSTISTDEFDTKSYSTNIDFMVASASGQFQTGKDVFFIPEIAYSMALSNDHFDKYGAFSLYGGIRLLY